MNTLAGQVASVTGASKGLADDGAAVVVNDACSREGADRVVAEIETAGLKAIAVQAAISPRLTSSRCSTRRSARSDAL